MFGGGGGMNPRKMKQMMEQMGIDVDELDASEVVIRTDDGEELYFDAPSVTRMDARGQETYQIVGSPETRDSTAGEASADAGDAESESDESGDSGIPEDDVELVAMRADVGTDAAREALEAENGDLAAAVDRLE